MNKIDTDDIQIVYQVTATAVLTRGVYEGPMTEEGWRGELATNPDSFSIRWSILSVENGTTGGIIAASGEQQ